MRASSFRKKPSDAWLNHFNALADFRFYLMAKHGPTVFQLKDDDDNVFRVALGNPISCTCNGCSPTEVCIHVVYCITKVLKVNMRYPVAYQTSLTDSEIDQILSGTFSDSHVRSRAVTRVLRRTSRQLEAEEVKVQEPEAVPGQVTRQELSTDEEENCCPICQEVMKSSQMSTLTWCRMGCGNNLHTLCMNKFAQHRQSQHKDTSCPLCRSPWDLEILRKDLAWLHAEEERRKKSVRKSGQSKRHLKLLPVYCNQCSCLQRQHFFRCLQCTHLRLCRSRGDKPFTQAFVDLCEDCLRRGMASTESAHLSHHFLCGTATVAEPRDAWELGPGMVNVALSLVESLPSANARTVQRNCWCCRDPPPGETLLTPSCGHAAHRSCMLSELIELIAGRTSQEGAELSLPEQVNICANFRCTHNGCGNMVFGALRRAIEADTSSTANSAQAQSTTAGKEAGQQLTASFLPMIAQGVGIAGSGSGSTLSAGESRPQHDIRDDQHRTTRPPHTRTTTGLRTSTFSAPAAMTYTGTLDVGLVGRAVSEDNVNVTNDMGILRSLPPVGHKEFVRIPRKKATVGRLAPVNPAGGSRLRSNWSGLQGVGLLADRDLTTTSSSAAMTTTSAARHPILSADPDRHHRSTNSSGSSRRVVNERDVEVLDMVIVADRLATNIHESIGLAPPPNNEPGRRGGAKIHRGIPTRRSSGTVVLSHSSGVLPELMIDDLFVVNGGARISPDEH